MKIAVFASPEDQSILLSILETLKGLELPAYGLKIGAGWEGLSRAALGKHLGRATHYLIVCSPRSLGASWLRFAAGYGFGREGGFSLYRVEASWEPPPYLSGIPILDGLEELSAYYRMEKAEWMVLESRRAARTALLDMGVSYSAESFARSAAEGDTKAVELFLVSGYSPDTRDRHGVPALCLAARGRHLNSAELLLEYGAALDLRSEDRGYSPLMDAVLQGSAELLELFLSRGADPDIQSKDGQTALVIAVGRGDAAMAERLLAYGADPDIPDKLGLSARRYASLFKSEALVRLFEAAPTPTS